MKIPKSIVIGGLRYRIVFVDSEGMKEEVDDPETEGVTDIEGGRIVLHKRLLKNPTRLRDTLVHEVIGHALWDACGIGHWLKERTKLRGKKWYRFQEIFIRWHTPALVATLKELGLIQ